MVLVVINTPVEVSIKGEPASFENTLYIDAERSIYLLESRAFSKCDDRMIGAYLEVFNFDGVAVDDYIDDVWSYGEWSTFQ